MSTEGNALSKYPCEYAASFLNCEKCRRNVVFMTGLPVNINSHYLQKYTIQRTPIEFELCFDCYQPLMLCTMHMHYVLMFAEYVENNYVCPLCGAKHEFIRFIPNGDETEILILQRFEYTSKILHFSYVHKYPLQICMTSPKNLRNSFGKLSLLPKNMFIYMPVSTDRRCLDCYCAMEISSEFDFKSELECTEVATTSSETIKKPVSPKTLPENNTKMKPDDDNYVSLENRVCPPKYIPKSSCKSGRNSIILIKKDDEKRILLFHPTTVNLKKINDKYEDVLSHFLRVVNDIIEDGCNSIMKLAIELDSWNRNRINNDASLAVLNQMVGDWEDIMNTIFTNVGNVFDKDVKSPILLKLLLKPCYPQLHAAKLRYLNVIIKFLDEFRVFYEAFEFMRTTSFYKNTI